MIGIKSELKGSAFPLSFKKDSKDEVKLTTSLEDRKNRSKGSSSDIFLKHKDKKDRIG